MNDEDLSPAELELVNHSAAGTWCRLSGRPLDQRRVRDWVLYELCVRTPWPVHAKGVQLSGAIIDDALDFEFATLRAPLSLHRCNIRAAVNFASATVPELRLAGSEIAEPLSLNGATVANRLDLRRAKLNGANAAGVSLSADGLHVGGLFTCDGLETRGAIWLPGATIDSDFSMDGAKLRGSDNEGNALVGDSLCVAGLAHMAGGFETFGGIRLLGATIEGGLIMTGAKLQGSDNEGNALFADGIRVAGGAFLDQGFEAHGVVRFLEATFDHQLALVRAGTIQELVLSRARCASLADDETSWPTRGHLRLGGFRFSALTVETRSEKRLDWVRRQGLDEWSPDPYEQLAAYYASTGDEAAARRIHIAKNDDELAHLKKTRRDGSLGYRFWRRPFGWLLGYGYRRWPAGALLVVALVAAGGIFLWAERDGAMVPNEPVVDDSTGDPLPCGETYPCFNSWVYGADVVLPIIDFGQDDAWRPIETANADQWWIWARWGFIALGWVLASVFVAAFTALVQRT